ncbi:uncharacterized protein LOC108101767 [Drosophila ficusphila]|uniref:uncharacterized protein LOC108101767 n=1 Tax=Drosophila ficusphila TaxID=30025 RepID=UPI0007E6A524|nr:uncharacterized protein LOC108101767 [Drosophila ficusphila]
MVAAAKAKAHQQLMNEMRNNEPKFKALQQYKIPKLADKVVSYARPTAFETAPKIGSEIPKPKYSRPNLPTRSNGSLLKSSMRPNLTFESAQAKRNYEYYQVQLRNFELQRGQSYHPDQATRLNAHYPVRSYVPPYSDSHLRSGYPREYLEQDYYPLRGVENYPRGYAMEDLYNMRERQLQGRPMYHPIRGAENYQRDYPYENIPPPRQGYYPRGYEAYQREYQNENVHLNAREQDADRIVSVAFAGRKYMTLQDLRERTKLSKDCLHKILKRIGKVKQPKWRISKSYLKAYEMESAGLAPPKDQESSVTLTEAICKVIKGFRGSQFQRIDTLVDRTGFREEKLKRVLKKIGKKRSTKWRLIAYKKPLIHLHRGHKGSSTALNTISNTIAHYN